MIAEQSKTMPAITCPCVSENIYAKSQTFKNTVNWKAVILEMRDS